MSSQDPMYLGVYGSGMIDRTAALHQCTPVLEDGEFDPLSIVIQLVYEDPMQH